MNENLKQLRERALQFIERLDEETGTMWTEDDDKIAKAFVDFHKQELSGKEIYEAVKILKLFDDFMSENFYSFNPHIGKYFKTSEDKMAYYSFETVYQEFVRKKLTLSGEESSMEQRP